MTKLRFTAGVTMILSAAACEQKSEPVPVPPAAASTPPASEPSAGPTRNDLPAMPAAPWSAPPIASTSIPRIYSDVWRVAENRSRCALLAPVALSPEDSAAASRKATFSGGWAVAYDLPQLRSAFGVAGSGSDAWGPDTYAQWPHNTIWSDRSSAGYGPEAGTGPNWLAYVKIPGQGCLYNVWSRRGQTHLERIIESLRFVTMSNQPAT
jgi:hypothetical protein